MRSANGWARAALLSIATLATTLALSTSANAAGWGPEFELSRGATVTVGTHINEQGDVTFIGSEQVRAETVEIFARFEHGNSTRVTRKAIARIENVDLVAGDRIYAESGQDGRGRVSLAWIGEPGWDPCVCGNPSTLFATRLGENGAPLAEPLTVADYSEESPRFTSTSYAVAADGQAVIGATLVDPATEESWIEIFEIDPDFNTVKKISPSGFGTGADLIRIATNASGRMLAAWRTIDGDADKATINAQFLTTSGPGGSASELFSTDETENPRVDSVLIGEDGDGTVAFTETDVETMKVVKIAADGSARPPVALELAAADLLEILYDLPGVHHSALLPDGSALFAYLTYDEAESETGLSTFVVAKDGSLRTHEIAAPIPDAMFLGASLSQRSDGTGGVTFFQIESLFDADKPVSKLIYQPLDQSGAPSGPKELLASDVVDTEFLIFASPRVAMNGRGEIAASWTVFNMLEASIRAASGRIYDGAAPIVSIKAPATAVAGSETVLVASVSDRNETTTTWNFGDGQTADGEVQVHTFKRPGTYELKVKSTDSLGNIGTATKRIRVVADRSGKGSAKRPDTRITRPPRLRLRAPRAVIRFTSPDKKATFECRIGRGPIAGSRLAKLRARGKGPKGLTVKGKWRKCSSPLRLRRLRPAVYVVRIRAVGQNRLKDRTPAVARFRVLKPSRPGRSL